MMDQWMDAVKLLVTVYITIRTSAINGSSAADQLLYAITATWNMYYDGSMEGCVPFGHDICYGSSAVEQLLYSIIVTWNMFYDGAMEGCVPCGLDICTKWVSCSRITVPFNYCDLDHVL